MKDLRTEYTALKVRARKLMEMGNIRAYLNTLLEVQKIEAKLA